MAVGVGPIAVAVGEGPIALALFDLFHRLTVDVLTLVAVALGSFWVLINLYVFYPLTRRAVEEAIDGFRALTWSRGNLGIRSDGGLRRPLSRHELADEPPAVTPSIHVLLPAYEEAGVIEQSIASIRDARYPADQLSVTVLLEPDDGETPDALATLQEYYDFEVLTVPERYPGTSSKPRALDYGFEHTDAEIVGIIDAEDVVEPNLFEEVARGIVEEGHTVVQGRLDMVNEDDGWLNTVFRAEFGVWFEYVLPSFTRTGYPLPLGGTTCFFRRSALVAMGVKRQERFGDRWGKADELWARHEGLFGRMPWSMENVTEDFELGLFMWMDDHSIGYLDSTTAQESPVKLDNWIRQRTRWEKGKLYTLLQYLRNPSVNARDNGHAVFQSGLPLLGPINIVGMVVIFMLGNAAAFDPGPVVSGLLALGLAFLVMVAGTYGLGYWAVSDRPLGTKLRRTIVVVLTIPVYWLLQWGAALRAGYQMYNGWLDWERTTHNGRNGNGSNGTVAKFTVDAPAITIEQRVVAVLTALAIGLGLRIANVGTWPLWNDEIYSVAIRSANSWQDVLFATGDPHPPLYYLLLHGWTSVFGQTLVSARALSIFLATGTILGTYLLGRELFDDATGLIGAFLVAISTFHIHTGTTARMYELLALLAVLSWYFFARLHDSSRTSIAGYLLVTVPLLYTHLAGFLVLAAQHVYVVFSESHARVSFRRWIRLQAVVVAGAIPVLVLLYQQVVAAPTAGPGPVWWVPEPSREAILKAILGYLGYPNHYPILGGSTGLYLVAVLVLLVAAGALVLAIASYHPRYGFVLTARDGTAQMAVLFVVALLGPYVFSHLVSPVFAPRYTLPASIALLLLVADGIMNLPTRKLQAGVLVFLAMTSGILIAGYLGTDSVEPWNQAGHALETQVQPGDQILLVPGWIEPDLEHYYTGPQVEMIQVWEYGDVPATIRDETAPDRRVWLVHFGEDPPTTAVSVLRASHMSTSTQRYGWITIVRFEPTGSGAPASLEADATVLGLDRPAAVGY